MVRMAQSSHRSFTVDRNYARQPVGFAAFARVSFLSMLIVVIIFSGLIATLAVVVSIIHDLIAEKRVRPSTGEGSKET